MGGVLVDLHPQRCIEAFEKLGARDVATYVREFRTEDLFYDIEVGRMTTEAFCEEVRRVCHISASDEKIAAAWNALLEPFYDNRSELLLNLKAQGYRLFILSNTCALHWQYASQKLIPARGRSIDDYFERAFLSFELHNRKPAPSIFIDTLEQAGINADETLFIDDNELNIRAAADLGFHTFYESDNHSWKDFLPQHLQGYSATIGFFDGVHKGHKHIIQHLLSDAQEHHLGATLITFRQHPRQVLQQDYVPQLLTLSSKKEHLLRADVPNVISLDFTTSFAQQSAADFMLFLREKYNVKRLLIGYDHRFGHNRSEGFNDYQRIGKEIGMEVVPISALALNDINISSSVIRRLLAEGDIALANDYLGYAYGFEGIVIRGRGEGRKIGFPTANMSIDKQQLIPKRGVYAVKVYVEGVKGALLGMMNIGCRPTYGGEEETVEVNIFHFDEDIYDRRLSVELLHRLREECKFNSIAALVHQLESDRAEILSSAKI